MSHGFSHLRSTRPIGLMFTNCRSSWTFHHSLQLERQSWWIFHFQNFQKMPFLAKTWRRSRQEWLCSNLMLLTRATVFTIKRLRWVIVVCARAPCFVDGTETSAPPLAFFLTPDLFPPTIFLFSAESVSLPQKFAFFADNSHIWKRFCKPLET